MNEQPQSAGSYRFRVGDFQCLAVTDGVSAFPAAVVFGNPSDTERERVLVAHGKPTDMVESSLTSVVVDTGRNRVLIDTGVGAFTPATGKLLANLRAAGVDPGEIDTVILTHGHPDHIAGTIDAEGLPAFPNARYVMRQGEWDFWTDEQVLAKAMAGTLHNLGELDQFMGAWARQYLPPIEPRLELIGGTEGEEIVPGIYALPAPGHTSHHMALTIASGNEQLLNLVDVAINPIHLAEPEWHPAFDWDPAQALATRRRIYDRAAADNARILIYHFPFPGIGRVRRAGRGWRWEPEAEV
ncbi:MAG TPA: MBL fold metallo-hydrolase [Thermomicrobiaceae bacterium]|nr:MBL fold metallo-hydrolase [Thermomicrobiaceae bacterium]